ncbi:MAG: polyprenol monophosphomannose synthase [Flavobacteriaceae bacterium]|nr:polyprenol monophosphomannose synthase [Flavobacteriaceae bacterium]MBT3753962.1 polyprenol monophosphomannose synthase [Flavobacteriaceae bacterium]MBT3793777.1 polyprenol monophosphomannose synthase [Flavobacteriaceae bacterium]MBT4415822.1 polyprenol monophosphomannose synthase [Flavobacteriaceae bacterium]MBT5012627.1 polyprenol monophosphomannose synthase [Flavobacteriaceae bacterium]
MKMSKALVIIPTYNELNNISIVLNQVLNLPIAFYVLVVDDNSPDGTSNVVNQYINKFKDRVFLLSRKSKQGLGKAYTEGFFWALENQYNYIFEMDADLSHDPKDLVRMHQTLELSNCDVVIGSRYINGINVINWPLSRILLSYFASIYSRVVTGLPVKDATSGFVGYRNIVLRTINLKTLLFNGYAFQIELKFKAFKNGFNIVEIPIIFKDRENGESKMNGDIIYEAVFGLIKMKFYSYFYNVNK